MWHQLIEPWRSCLEEAWTAFCAGSVPIGAVITDSTGQVIARGRNRVFDSSLQGSNYLSGTRMAHAEINALLAFGEYKIDPAMCTLYTTTEPCPMCIGAIRMHSIGKVCYASRDPIAGSMDLATATPFMQRGNIRILGPQLSELEIVLVAMHMGFWLQHGGSWATAIEAEGPEYIPGTQLGRRLFHLGELGRLRENNAPIKEVLKAFIQELRRIDYKGG